MPQVSLRKATVEIPIFDSTTRSLRTEAIRLSIGGIIGRNVGNALIVKALSDIDLDIRDGDRVGILGHNGAGKSTLLRLMAGIYHPTKGEVVIEGRVATLFDAGLGFNQDATGYDNILMGGMYLGMNLKEIRAKIPDIAAFSELGDFLHLPVRTYSQGMLARLSFSLATSIDPEILILDEQINTSDERFIKKIEKRIDELISRAKIMILATHDRKFIESWCTKAILMEHGRVVQFGPVHEVMETYNQQIKNGSTLTVG